MNKRGIYLQAPQILKSWLGYLDLVKPFPFLQLWAKCAMWIASIQNQCILHKAQPPTTLWTCLSRPAAFKCPGTCDLMKAFRSRLDSNTIKSQWDPLNMDNMKGIWSPLWTPLISRVPIHCWSVSEWMCKLVFKFMLKIAYLTLWTLTFWKDFGPVLSYCHTVAFSANMKGLKAAPVNRPTRKKKRQHVWLTASLERIYAHFLEQYCYLLAFIIVPSIPNTL